MAKSISKKPIPKAVPNIENTSTMSGVFQYLLQKETIGWVIFAIAVLVYLNTIGHEYTQDDAIVITDNMFTTKGLSGISGILSNDTFFGFFKEAGKQNLVSGGRYRPFTLILFAIEYQIFGKNPFIGHLFNILYFALSCFLIYHLLWRVLSQKLDVNTVAIVSFVAALIFAIHPIHTEVVANIKGRDEIMALLLSLTAIWCLLNYYDNSKILWLFLGGVSYFFALMSKENAITFLAIFPLILYFFYDKSISQGIVKSSVMWVCAAVFLVIRFRILGASLAAPSGTELMNNPFIKIVNGQYMPFTTGEKFATILYTWGLYLKLLIFPHPLTHDYYPRHVDMMTFGNPKVLISILIYLGLIFVAYRSFMDKKPMGFAILFFLLTFSIVSNLLFPIGTNMSERFMYMPSVGFALGIGLLFSYLWKRKINPSLILGLLVIIFLGFSYKTISRNTVWVSNSSLFLTDVKTSVNSAKLQNAAGGTLWDLSVLEKDSVKRKEMWAEAKIHLNKALEIHPNYKEAHLLMGNVLYAENNFKMALAHYDGALKIDANYKDALRNKGFVYRDYARYLGEKEGNLAGSLQMLLEAQKIIPDDFEVNRLFGIAYGMQGNTVEAIRYFEKATKIEPKNATAFLNLQIAYKQAGRIQEANEALQKAFQLDPTLKPK
ncbi:MAG: tetratricopeptide repeat protein [Saprospiraceae bacterium]|nr:tetratricopeptide repeat protein [Saprospiraceae bacterium]